MEQEKVALLFLSAVIIVGVIGTVVSIMPADTGAATYTYSQVSKPVQQRTADLAVRGATNPIKTYSYTGAKTSGYTSSINPYYSGIYTRMQVQPQYSQAQKIDLGVRPKSTAVPQSYKSVCRSTELVYLKEKRATLVAAGWICRNADDPYSDGQLPGIICCHVQL
jgi:hypothetical protein